MSITELWYLVALFNLTVACCASVMWATRNKPALNQNKPVFLIMVSSGALAVVILIKTTMRILGL